MISNLSMTVAEYGSVEHIDEVTSSLEWPTRYRQLERGPYKASVASFDGDSHFLLSERSSRAVEAIGGSPPDTTVFAIISGGTAVINGREWNPGQLLVLEAGAEFRISLRANCTVVQLGVASDFLADFLNRMKQKGSPSSVSISDLGSAGTKRLESALKGCLLKPSDMAVISHAVNAFGPVLDICDDTAIPKHTSGVQRALTRAREYIEGNLERTLLISEVAAYAGTSQRTLERGFAAELGVTPEQYVRAIRLHKVRQILLKPNVDEDRSVTSVANRCGFNHLGRFAKEYRRFFGELPSETLAALSSEPPRMSSSD